MRVSHSRLQGCVIVEPQVHGDERGFFLETFQAAKYQKEAGINLPFFQDNHSRSSRGVLRGLHFQTPPHTETKLVRVIEGAVFDVFVDLREGSPTFGEWGSYELQADRNEWLYLPRGIAHGMCTLTPNMVMQYKVDNCFTPEADSQIKWDDPDLKINWPVKPTVVSEKDTNAGSFRDFLETHGSLKV